MISLDEIRHMLSRFNDADETGELTNEGDGARKALQWVLEEIDYEEMDDMLPEEEVCPDCESSDCSGAAGGTCDDAEEEDEKDPNEFQIDLGLKGSN